jgi:hypothetical protein
MQVNTHTYSSNTQDASAGRDEGETGGAGWYIESILTKYKAVHKAVHVCLRRIPGVLNSGVSLERC